MSDPASEGSSSAPVVAIATPLADNSVKACLTNSVVNATRVVHALGGSYHFMWVNSANLIYNRNKILNLVLEKPAITQVLFLDSDMDVETRVFRTLFRSAREYVGAIYPRRQINLAAYGDFRAGGMPHAEALARALTFTVRSVGKEVRISGELVEVAGTGFGCVLLSTALLRRMITEDVVQEGPIGEGETGIDFFSLLPLKGGLQLSEDFSFCARVLRTSGGQVWGYGGPGVGHVGEFTYTAPFLDYIHALARPSGDKPR